MREHLLPLAMARYPKESPDMALELFESDRRFSGLGALGRCNHRTGVYRSKEVREDGYVYYRIGVDLPAREELVVEPFSFDFQPYAISATCKTRFHPADAMHSI